MTDLKPLLAEAAGVFTDLVRSIEPGQLTAPTPCAEYDVRALIDHLLYWGPWLEAAARKEPAPVVEGGAGDGDLTGGDWAAALVRQVGTLRDALAEPGAFEGTTTMGGGELPASMIAEMVLTEWVLHGWDLARATDRELRCTAAVASAVYSATAAMAPQGREMKIFAPEVPVPSSSSALTRAVALSGRSPAWHPCGKSHLGEMRGHSEHSRSAGRR
jgi:uncharacterized protein (TIGR03086 family)